MKDSHFFFCLIMASLLTACNTGSDTDLQDSITEATTSSEFDPAGGKIPFPNNLLFTGSLDGTLNIPVEDPDNLADPQVALNALDGFSTIAPMTTTFGSALDASSIGANAVRLFEVALAATPGNPVGSVTRELSYGEDFIASLSAADTSHKTLAIVPLKPLAAKTAYYVAITRSLKAAGGGSIAASSVYTLAKSTSSLLDASNVSTIPLLLSNEQAQALEPLRVITSTSEQAVTAASDLTVQDIILSWSYVTQSTADVLAEVRTIIRADTVPNSLLVDTGADSPMGAANLFAGTLSVPYYLSAAASTNDPSPLASFWKGAGDSLLTQHNLTPVSNSTETIPLLVSVPKTASGAVPTVIYQHGITTNRGTVLAIADSFAANGFAVVAIDMPLHGLTGNEINGTEAFKTGFERTFDLDLVTQDATGGITAATPDGTTDSSGRHFINLSNLQNSRDNVRQAVSDLFSLTYALTTMNAGGVTFDTSKVYFLGHSLGGMVGLTFLALEPADSVQDAVIAMSGGGIAKLLDGSAAFGPSIAAGLAAQQVIKGTPEYESFMGAAQTVLDSGDPINYAEAAATGRGILFFEVVGGSGVPSDTVIPNTVPDTNDISGTTPSPLSGTDPLTRALGLTQYNETTTAVDLKALVKFSAGDHGSILSPAANSAVTVEMQTQAVTFFASDLQNGANTLSVSNSAIIAAP